MSDDSPDSGKTNPDGSTSGYDSVTEWSSKKREITYEQGKNVLQAQKDDINQIDDKALRTVRITAVIIGVGATALQVTDSISINETTGRVGIFFLFISLSLGFITYNESSEIVGPTAKYLDDVNNNRLDKPWEEDLLHQYPGWISRNQEKVERNALIFSLCQSFLVLGLVFGAGSLLELNLVKTIVVLGVLLLVLMLVYVIARARTGREHPD